MKFAKRLAFAAALSFAAAGPGAATDMMALSDGETASLEAAMQAHIDQMSVDGVVYDLDAASGKIRKLFPAKTHPMMMMVGRYYLLCADLRDEAGQKVTVNFYAAKDNDRYVIFYSDFAASEKLERLIEQNAKMASN